MIDSFLRKYFRYIRIICIILQLTLIAYFVVTSQESLAGRLVIMGWSVALFVAGIIIASIMLGIQVINSRVPQKLFVASCNSFIISGVVGYIMLLTEFFSGSAKIGVLATSAIIGFLLSSIFIKNRYLGSKSSD